MILLVAMMVRAQSPATAADFFPLTPGLRRIYEEKGEAKLTVIDEVAAKPTFFDDKPSFAIYRKSQFNQIMDTTFYRVDGPAVMIVGYSEDRRAATGVVGQPVDLSRGDRKNVLMSLIPAMPVFKYENGPTQWTYAEVPKIQGPLPDPPIKGEETSIVGSAKLGPIKTILGRKVETLLVKTEVQLGLGRLGKTVVETSVYGRGIGLIETVIKTTVDKKSKESRSTLVGIEEKKEGS